MEQVDQKKAATFGSEDELIKKADDIAEKTRKIKSSNAAEGKEEYTRILSQLLISLFVLSERHGVILEDSFLQTIDDLILDFVS